MAGKTPKPKPKGKGRDEGDGKDAGSLTCRQRLFVQAYLGAANGNASEAARMVGIPSPQVQGSRLLKNVMVRAAIAARVAEAAMSADEVLARLSDLASTDLGDFLTIDSFGIWRVDMAKARKADRLRIIKKIKAGQFGTEIELHSPYPALEQLARYHGLNRDKGPDRTEAASAIEPGLAAEISEFALRRIAERGGPSFDPPPE